MTKTKLARKTKAELEKLAKGLGLSVSQRMTKAVMIDTILESQVKTPEKPQADNLEVEGASKKFEIQEKRPFPEPSYPIDETRDLPQGYGDTKIIAMVRDPYWVFVYWEINHDKRRELGALGADIKSLVLRVWDVTGVSFNGFNAHGHFDVKVNDITNNWYLQMPSANRSWSVDLGVLDQDGSFILIARSNTVSTPRDTLAEEEYIPTGEADPASPETQKEIFEIYQLSGGYKVGELAGSESIAELLAQNLSSGALASSANIPVDDRETGSGEKDFWLVVDTELIVYGATEPGSELTIQGQRVELRPDGSFSARFALPDGEQVIPVRAVNADGDLSREITPRVTRSTKYD